MDDSTKQGFKPPPEQQAIRDKFLHPLGTFVEFPIEESEQSIPDRFEKIVEMFPGRLAVKMGDQTLTYDELNKTANRIAHASLELSETIEEPIALMLEQGVDVVAAILGTLKAGKIYVPLDPAFPMSRNQDILQDSTTRLIITNTRNVSLANDLAGKGISVINIDKLAPSIGCANPPSKITADTLAYILYTSGSTGKPKGVVQNHRNVLHLIMRHTNRARITPRDRLAVLRSFNVHGGTLMTFAAILNGAAILPFDTKSDGLQELAHWLDREKITLCRMGPTLLRHLNAILKPEDYYPKLREISFSGEPLYWPDVERSRKHFPNNCTLVNSFGSTEVSSCCEFIIATDHAPKNGVVPCGYPTSEMEILLLQENGKETALGDIGEIAVKSRFLALKYWRNPALTGMKFLPGSAATMERIYLTGDQGRLSPDGCLEHLGRKDFQVKLRGYRIELSEIESALLSLDNIREAVVVPREDQAGENHLVAYVVPQRQPIPSTTTLRRSLQNILPNFMLPEAYVVLDQMPLTPNGKVDRKAFPAPTGSRPDLDTTFVAARNSIEEKLAAIWTEVLGIEDIGIYDNFLDLGGHSLAATRVASRINAAYHIELPLAQFVKTPTIAALADHLENAELSSVKYEPIYPVLPDKHLPLSFSQQRLWFLNQLAPDNPVYNEPKALRLKGSLDIDVLIKSLDAIVARHDVLRTTFSSVDDKPTQVIHPPGALALCAIDVPSFPFEQREKELNQILSDFARRPFDLEKDWPLRAALIRWADEEHVLVIVTHHIASDGWSTTILFRELSLLYSAFMTGSRSPLSELQIQYADFAAWQHQWLQGSVLETQLAYWRKQLSGAPAILSLPTDRPRPAVQSFRGRNISAELPTELTMKLKALSRAEGATLFMTLLAVFQILLQRYTRQNDLLVGTPVANRTRLELETLIGCFVNTLVLRVNLSDDPSFRELLRRAREICVGAFSHQELPFEKIVEELTPQRNLTHSPLVQVMFQVKNVPQRNVRLPSVEIEELNFDRGIAKFDLALTIVDRGNNLIATMEYDSDLFERATVERMLGHYQWMLQGVVDNPDQRISDVPMLTESEQHQLLVEWNDTKTDYPKDQCIHQLFEEQVEKTPGATAVVFKEQRLTYRELNNRANQVAHYLQKSGVGPEALVGICVERSIEMIVGLLGIFKAGGAYVPLDSSNPKERLGFVLEDTQVAIVLTDVVSLTILPPTSARVICLDRDWEELAKEPPDNPDNDGTADNLAYIIYTSGTAGTPKGVMANHRNLVNYLCWFNASPLAQNVQSLPMLSRASFDASLKQLFAPLLRAGQVWILSDEVVNQPIALLEALTTRSRVGLNCVPSLWRAVLDELSPDRVPAASRSLSALLLGGEPLDRHLQDRTFAAMPELEIWNLYGPTEATANACTGMVIPHCTPTIGRPIGNTQIYILDGNLQPVPIGVLGEMHIGGDGLARGYLNRPELTAEQFIANPFSEIPGAKLYKTGDLARYLPDGNIEFLGRIDNQVKIRGYRIELGEVESVLAQHPAIQQAVVLAREDTPGDRRLVAYTVATANFTPSALDLRGFLQHKLPDYMTPSVFIILDSLPLTPNGKLDRKALPAPDHRRPEVDEAFAAPRTPVEEVLASIWRTVLKLDNVGIYENFFDLGGHSLLATRVVSRIRESLLLELPLRALFEAPTIHGIAQKLQDLGDKQDVTQTAHIAPVARGQYRVQTQ